MVPDRPYGRRRDCRWSIFGSSPVRNCRPAWSFSGLPPRLVPRPRTSPAAPILGRPAVGRSIPPDSGCSAAPGGDDRWCVPRRQLRVDHGRGTRGRRLDSARAGRRQHPDDGCTIGGADVDPSQDQHRHGPDPDCRGVDASAASLPLGDASGARNRPGCRRRTRGEGTGTDDRLQPQPIRYRLVRRRSQRLAGSATTSSIVTSPARRSTAARSSAGYSATPTPVP